jgi:hypothetical protein
MAATKPEHGVDLAALQEIEDPMGRHAKGAAAYWARWALGLRPAFTLLSDPHQSCDTIGCTVGGWEISIGRKRAYDREAQEFLDYLVYDWDAFNAGYACDPHDKLRCLPDSLFAEFASPEAAFNDVISTVLRVFRAYWTVEQTSVPHDPQEH